MKHLSSMAELIGHTPLVEYPLLESLGTTVHLKLERYNPTLSVKDRMALNMVVEAERAGLLHGGGTIIESSSGNTATSLAMIAAAKGYKFIAVMDDHALPEKTLTVQAYGGQVVQIKSSAKGLPSPDERSAVAEKLAGDTPGSVFLNQRHNPANAAAYRTMASELEEQLPEMDALVGTIGTAGTLCGTARALKHDGRKVHVLAVEPQGSTFFSDTGGPYHMQGAGRPPGASVPKNFDPQLIDDAVQVPDKAAFTTCVFLAEKLGLLVGGSSGAALLAALRYASNNPDRTVAVILPDAGEKYVSTIYASEWRAERSLDDPQTRDFLAKVTQTNHANGNHRPA